VCSDLNQEELVVTQIVDRIRQRPAGNLVEEAKWVCSGKVRELRPPVLRARRILNRATRRFDIAHQENATSFRACWFAEGENVRVRDTRCVAILKSSNWRNPVLCVALRRRGAGRAQRDVGACGGSFIKKTSMKIGRETERTTCMVGGLPWVLLPQGPKAATEAGGHRGSGVWV